MKEGSNLGLKERHDGTDPEISATQEQLQRAVLLFESDVSQVSVIDTDDAVILLEKALVFSLPSPLQTLDQQAKSPERFES